MNREPLLYEKVDGVGVMRLNRPEVLNALNEPLLRGLLAGLEDARRDEAIRCIVITGSGRAFSTGADLDALAAMGTAEFREYVGLLQRLSAEMRRVAKPSIAAVNGYALAGGFELALLCDIRVAADTARFGLPDTPIGLSPTSGLTYLLPRIVGMGWAKHLTFTAETIDARQAERIGLVTRVVPVAELHQVSRDMARAVAGHPPMGVRYTKLGFDRAADVDFHTALASEAEAEVTCFDTEAVRTNVRAFVARRKAKRGAGSSSA
ncbi:MAG: enoyl-CoA hydratase/isomerase family protein [Candidatus Rokubacteria bacterium]|nr:enoyl-CoA hydratase/isomerase family protein [Candidatus Rokubacteria bacterium]